MSSSLLVYDVMLDGIGGDRLAAESIGQVLRSAGKRVWSEARSADPSASTHEERTRAAAASRLRAYVISADAETGLENSAVRLEGRPPDLVLLAPGALVSAQDLPASFANAGIVDLRGMTTPAAQERPLVSAIEAWHRGGDRLTPTALKQRVVGSYDRIAEKFAARWSNHPPVQTLESFVSKLPATSRVLDAGCGPGHHAQFLARCGHEVTGIDLSEGMLRIARRSVHGIRLVKMDIQALRFPAGTFDGIWCAGAAMHIPREDILSLLRGFRSALRPAGVLGLAIQVGRSSEIVRYDDDDRFFEYYRDPGEVSRLVARAGFRVVASDYGETARNTHGLDLTLKWATVYAERCEQFMQSETIE